MSAPAQQMRRSLNSGGENPEFLMRDFTGGISDNDAREAIGEHEFWWCENAIPLARANLVPLRQNSAALVSATGETQNPTYTMSFTIFAAGVPVDYVFAAFGNTGNGWIVNLNTNIATKIIAGLLSASGTFATGYNAQGLLIIDPNGYWDWNITTAATLTAQNNSITGGTLFSALSVAGGTSLTNNGLIPGTGGNIEAIYTAISVVINAAGTGYVVGDALTITGGTPAVFNNNPTVIIVASVGGGGAITGINFSSQGTYLGPGTGLTQQVGPSGATVAGGTGTGATFKVTMKATGTFNVVSGGTGYTSGTFTDDMNGISTVTAYSIQTSGVIGGTAIATYAGRVWIANGRTVYFTNIDSYNYFGLAGGFFTMPDSYLRGAVTCLWAANNYLYIFGDTSIDALSNVTITAGVTFFSRINIVTGIGTSTPSSVCSYYRSVVFAHGTGVYLLAGATPEKISEKISLVWRQLLNPGGFSNSIYTCTVNILAELCICVQFWFLDNITLAAVVRPIMMLYFRGRWFAYSLNFTMAANAPIGVVSAQVFPFMFAWGVTGGAPFLTACNNAASAGAPWIVKTKFWDGNAPLHEKQAINAAIAGVWTGGAASGVTLNVDTELGTYSRGVPLVGVPNGYQLPPPVQVEIGGSQYLGLTFKGDGTDVASVNLLALRGKQERNMML